MNTYLISYDLGVPETTKDYQRLIDNIKSYGNWAKPLYSEWFIKTNKSVSEVRDGLKTNVDSNDKILVIDVTNASWASYNLPTDVAEWMKNNL